MQPETGESGFRFVWSGFFFSLEQGVCRKPFNNQTQNLLFSNLKKKPQLQCFTQSIQQVDGSKYLQITTMKKKGKNTERTITYFSTLCS